MPWLFDEESVDVLRFFSQLKCRLMPYLYSAARQAHVAGTPVMRPMLLEFPNDPASDTLDRQYMLGESLLVAPVLSNDGLVDYYLPAGRWTHLLTNEVVEGGGWRSAQYGYQSLPLFVRPNSAIVMGDNYQRPDYDFGVGFALCVYQLADGATATAVIPAADGSPAVTFTVHRAGNDLAVQWQGAPKNWRLLLVGIESNGSISGGSAESSAAGLLITPAAEQTEPMITLHIG